MRRVLLCAGFAAAFGLSSHSFAGGEDKNPDLLKDAAGSRAMEIQRLQAVLADLKGQVAELSQPPPAKAEVKEKAVREAVGELLLQLQKPDAKKPEPGKAPAAGNIMWKVEVVDGKQTLVPAFPGKPEGQLGYWIQKLKEADASKTASNPVQKPVPNPAPRANPDPKRSEARRAGSGSNSTSTSLRPRSPEPRQDLQAMRLACCATWKSIPIRTSVEWRTSFSNGSWSRRSPMAEDVRFR